jgi:glycosyltransferase involved in cell wall biosynthesis
LEPLVSIIIPTFNRVSFLGETLDCILEQEYENWECIVVDDRSEDATQELLTLYREKDVRVRFILRPVDYPSGANSCRNIGFLNSKGKYIQYLDSDDLLSPDKINNQIILLTDSDANISTCRWGRFHSTLLDANMLEMKAYKDFRSSKQFIDTLAEDLGYFPIHSYLFKREVLIKAGPWLERLLVNQDGEFIIRVIANAKRICFSKKGFVLYRRSSHTSTSQYNRVKLKDLINSWKIIEGYLYIQYKDDNLALVHNAKKNIYSVCKMWPEILEENKSFFEGIGEGSLKSKISNFLKRNLVNFKRLKF